MPHVIKGSPVRTSWTVRDASLNPMSGQVEPTHVTFALHRDDGTAMIAATEDVSMVEIGTSGTYTITFTPLFTGHYVLSLRELVGLKRVTEFRYDVLQAGEGAAPTYANAYCAEVDVERWAQMLFGVTSTPSDSEVAAFAEARASELTGALASIGFTVSPSTVVSGSIEQDLLREANAIGAAADAVIAKFMDEAPSRTEKGEVLLKEYQTRVDRLVNYARRNKASLATDHILSGDTEEPAVGSTPVDAGIHVGMGSLF